MRGSSPWRFTYTSAASERATSATRSVPLFASGEVIRASPPAARTQAAIRSSSVATTTRSSRFAERAASHTCSTMGLPARGERGFPGNRMDANRAGMTPMINMQSSGLNSILRGERASTRASRRGAFPPWTRPFLFVAASRRRRGGRRGARAGSRGSDAPRDRPRRVDLVHESRAGAAAAAFLGDEGLRSAEKAGPGARESLRRSRARALRQRPAGRRGDPAAGGSPRSLRGRGPARRGAKPCRARSREPDRDRRACCWRWTSRASAETPWSPTAPGASTRRLPRSGREADIARSSGEGRPQHPWGYPRMPRPNELSAEK